MSWRIRAALFIPDCFPLLYTAGNHELGPVTEWVQAGAGKPSLSGLAKIASHLKNNNQLCQVISAFSCGSFGGDHRDHSKPKGQHGRVGLSRRSAGTMFKDKRFSHRKQCSKEQSSRSGSLLIKL